MTLSISLRGLGRKIFSLLAVLFVVCLASCAGSVEQPKPADLGPNAALIGVRQAWTANIGSVGFALDVKVNGTTLSLASSDGTVVALDARTGGDIWRLSLGSPLAAGVGSDGRFTAVISQDNELIAIEAGRELWRQKMPAFGYSAPLVAGARIFVLSGDRSVSAFDAQTGRKLWTQSRVGDPLVLRQAGVIMAVGDTLVVGMSGRLVGMNPQNGSSRWEVPIATPRGTNEIERLVDLVAHVSREGDVVCVRAFQAAVGCVNTLRGSLLWTRPASGAQGLDGDLQNIFGAESDGKLVAWRRNDGERVWVSDRLKYRGLTAPLAVGRSVAVGDSTGLVHLLSREDGSPLNRLSTDGTAIIAAPVLAGDTLVVVTKAGGIFGFRPE